jgi:hypothetical protein
MTIFRCLRFDTPPTLRARSLYLYPPGTGFPFPCLLRLAGLRWRYATPPPHGICPFIILIAAFTNLFRRNILLPVIILQRYGLGCLTCPKSELISESTNLLDVLVGFLGRYIDPPSRRVPVQDTIVPNLTLHGM